MKDYIDKLSKQICYALNQKQYQEFVLDKENNWEKWRLIDSNFYQPLILFYSKSIESKTNPPITSGPSL